MRAARDTARTELVRRVRVTCLGGTQWVVLSAATAKNRMWNASLAPKRRVPHAPTAIGGIADGVRRSTADTLERG